MSRSFNLRVASVCLVGVSVPARTHGAYAPGTPILSSILYLAARNTEEELTESERARYEGYVRANKFIAILQSKARKLVGGL